MWEHRSHCWHRQSHCRLQCQWSAQGDQEMALHTSACPPHNQPTPRAHPHVCQWNLRVWVTHRWHDHVCVSQSKRDSLTDGLSPATRRTTLSPKLHSTRYAPPSAMASTLDLCLWNWGRLPASRPTPYGQGRQAHLGVLPPAWPTRALPLWHGLCCECPLHRQHVRHIKGQGTCTEPHLDHHLWFGLVHHCTPAVCDQLGQGPLCHCGCPMSAHVHAIAFGSLCQRCQVCQVIPICIWIEIFIQHRCPQCSCQITHHIPLSHAVPCNPMAWPPAGDRVWLPCGRGSGSACLSLQDYPCYCLMAPKTHFGRFQIDANWSLN